MAAVGETGRGDVYIDNAHSVGDFQVILHRLQDMIETMQNEMEMNGTGIEQQMAQVRVDLRQMAVDARNVTSTASSTKYDLVDTKVMSPAQFSGERAENFKQWGKKVKAYTNAKLVGFRKALEATEKLGKDSPVDASVLSAWNWAQAVEADSKLHDMLLLVTTGEALGIVESVPGQGFESWRLLNVRFNSVGEMYTFDKMNSIMKQSQVKHISDLPASIAKFEKDLKIFRERTESEFPEVLKLPILIQMIPANWKKEFETQFRTPGSTKTYDSLVAQLLSIGNEERYNARRGPDDMDTDAVEAARAKSLEGKPANHDDFDYTDEQWAAHAQELQEELDWLGQQKGGKGRKGGGKGKGGKYPSGGKGVGGAAARGDASQVECLWCHKSGHFRKDCPELAAYKKEKDAERARKGDHSAYVPPARGGKRPTRGAGSLDEDWTECIGLTGDDDVDAAVLGEEFSLGKLEDFVDYEETTDDDDDGPDFVSESGPKPEPSHDFTSVDMITEMCGRCSEVTTPTNEERPWRAADRSTPLAHLFDRTATPSSTSRSTPLADLFDRTATPSSTSRLVAPPVTLSAATSTFYNCNWQVFADEDDEGSDTESISRSAVGLALRTDETAGSGSKHQDAARLGSMSKPVNGCTVTRKVKKASWPARRVTKESRWNRLSHGAQTTQETQTTVSIDHRQDVTWVYNTLADRTWVFESAAQGSCVDVQEGTPTSHDDDVEEKEESDDYKSCSMQEDENGDIGDVDVSLDPGEIAARKKQNATADDDGFFECNPEDVELCPVEIKERRFRIKRGLTADSGAGDPVMPRRMVNKKKIRQSEGQRRGLHYVSATNHRIPNVGEVNLEFMTDEGHSESIVFQIADVNKPLMSISDRVDNRCRVVFDQDDDTGEDLTHVYNKKTKKAMKLRRVGKVWVLDCTVTEDFLAETASVFSRPGP